MRKLVVVLIASFTLAIGGVAEAQSVAGGGDPSRFVYECKLYASVFRGALREQELVDLCSAGAEVLQDRNGAVQERH